MIVEKIWISNYEKWSMHKVKNTYKKKKVNIIMTTQSFCRIINCNDKIKSAFLNASSENK